MSDGSFNVVNMVNINYDCPIYLLITIPSQLFWYVCPSICVTLPDQNKNNTHLKFGTHTPVDYV